MENTPTAPTEAPQAPASVETPTTTEPAQTAPAQPIDLGLTAEQAEKFKTFLNNSGGFDNAFSKLKADISTPKSSQPAPTPEAPTPVSEPQVKPQSQPQPEQLPKGARTNEDIMAEFYFRTLSEKPEYAAIADDIKNGGVLTEMDKLGISYRYPNGAWNDDRINEFLKLKAQTVPAKQTSSEPYASTAPTVNYTEVGDSITSIEQAYQVLLEPGNPKMQLAEDYIKSHFTNSGKK